MRSPGCRNVAFDDPGWDPTTSPPSIRPGGSRRQRHPRLEQREPEALLRSRRETAHVARLADPQVTPQTSTIYFTNVLKTVGRQRRGLDRALHAAACTTAAVVLDRDRFDRMAAIDSGSRADGNRRASSPDTRQNGTVDRTRPLCPFGEVARWNGSGSTDDEKNFSCVAETVDTSVRLAPSAPRRWGRLVGPRAPARWPYPSSSIPLRRRREPSSCRAVSARRSGRSSGR